MRRIVLGVLLAGLGSPAFAVCPSPLTGKDAAGTTQNFLITVDPSGNCGSTVFSALINNPTLVSWTSATGSNTAIDIPLSGQFPNVQVTLDTGTVSGGAVTFRGMKANGSYESIPVAQVVNKNTLVPLTNPFTLNSGHTGATADDLLIVTTGYQKINVQLTTVITGVGTLAVGYTDVPYSVPPNGVLNPIAAGTAIIGKVGIDQTTPGSTNGVALTATPSNGWTPKWFVAANTDNATNLKASAGVVHAVEVYGIGSAPAYLKFYNKASSPTCASDTIVKQIMIPAAATAANGAGSNAIVLDTQFSTGISYCVVTGIGATDDTAPAASTFVINIDWD